VSEHHLAIAIPSCFLGTWLVGAIVSFRRSYKEQRMHWEKSLSLGKRLERAAKWPYWALFSF
jgi:hypothetical protein